MKKLFAFIAVLLLIFVAIPGLAQAQTKTLTFQWEQPLPLTDVAGWVLYYGTAPGQYQGYVDFVYQSPDPGTTNTFTRDTVITPPAGSETTYYFVLTAHDLSGNESDFSNEVMARIDFLAPGVPLNLRVTIKVQ